MLILTSAHKVFGVIVTDQRAFLMYVFSTQMLPLIETCSYHLHTAFINANSRGLYYQHVQEVEHGSFTTLVFTTSGGMGKCASVTYKRLASLLSTKQEQSYSAIIVWVRCLSFSLSHSSIMCLRGARSSQGRAFRSRLA